ncbi:hypothetical protein JL107_12810 [Nakamurella flavida]|uniref:O-antigen ligase family protein n=1 Tax=Nakamurella flavida TaxID=363630 RepID=A0A938YPY2_9ACTN|nr:hypothetical protein [Nakamurella flavida]MBM9477327.1 hypothetical protein [Nakamurella flavida]MDP9779783.1 hypothetical protein [Nakamurella flavida]
MVQLVGWIGICTVLAYFFRSRPIVLVLVALVLWAAVPGVASSMITGQPRGSSLAFHPATWLILLSFAFQVLHDVHAVLREIARRILTYLGLSLFLAVAFLATKTSRTGSGLVLFLSQMVAPILLFVLIQIALDRDPALIHRLRAWVVGIVAVQAALALVEWAQGGVLLYRAYYQTNYWFDEINFPRWMGTLDHPLTLSLLIGATIPLLAGFRSAAVQLPLLMLLAGGMLATQSRTGLAVAGLGIAYVVLASRIRPLAKIVSVVVVAVAAGYAATSSLSSGVADRLANDTGSTGARTAALQFFADHGSDFLFTGGGIGSASRVAELGGLTTSLESSILIYAVDVGVVFALLYFGIQAAIVVRGIGRRPPLPGLALTGAVMVIVPQTYNALNAQTIAGPFLWVVLGMVAAMTTHRATLTAAAGRTPTTVNSPPAVRPQPAAVVADRVRGLRG